MLFTWSLYLCRRRPTLPHTFACSTIGPAGLNFRVRDGNGCFPRGKITGNLRRFAGPGLKPRNLVGPLDGTAEAAPFQSDLANAALKRRTTRSGGTVKQPHKITTVSMGGR